MAKPSPIKTSSEPNPKDAPLLGWPGDEVHDKLRDQVHEQLGFLQERLAPWVQRALRHKALFLRASRTLTGRSRTARTNDQDPGRGGSKREGEAYRSTAVVPLAHRTVEAKASAVSDLLFSGEHMVEVEGISDDAYGESARYNMRLLDYTWEGNRLRSTMPAILRDCFTDGIKWLKPVWRKFSNFQWHQSSAADVDSWNERLLEVSAKAAKGGDEVPLMPSIKPTDEGGPEAWMEWSELMREAGHGSVGDLPVTGRKEIVSYEGPWIERPGFGDVLYDPESEFEDQNLIAEEMRVPVQDLIDQADPETNPEKQDPSKPFLLHALMEALQISKASNKGAWDRGVQARTSYMRMLGLDDESERKDSLFGDTALVNICYRQRDPHARFLVMVNRHAIINKDVTQFPHGHGRVGLIPTRHLRLDGHMVGMSAIHQGEPLMKEADRILAYTLDAMLLSILPVFTKLKNSPLPEGLQRLQAGTLVPVAQHDVIKRLTDTRSDIGGSIQLLQWIMSIIDDTESTPPSVRGAASTVGRVSATEEQGRFKQALGRIKLLAWGLEDDLQEIPQQCIGLWYEMASPEMRLLVGGKGDPFLTVDRSKILLTLNAKFRFNAASRAVNRAELLQNLREWMKEYASVMNPYEIRQAAVREWEEMGLKKLGDIFMPEQTEVLKLQAEVKLQQDKMAAMAMLMPQPQVVDAAPLDPMTGMPMAPPVPGAAPGAPPAGTGAPAGAPGAAVPPQAPPSPAAPAPASTPAVSQ